MKLTVSLTNAEITRILADYINRQLDQSSSTFSPVQPQEVQFRFTNEYDSQTLNGVEVELNTH